MPRLLILAPDAQGLRAYISARLPELDVMAPPTSEVGALKRLAREADYILAWRFAPGVLGDAPRLRWIQSFGAGVDHLLGAGLRPDVTITRIVGVFGPGMAEYVLGYCYAITLGLRRSLEQQRRTDWKPFSPSLLSGQTAVVVGLGSIGREVCRLLRAAGLRVLGVSRSGRALAEADQTFAAADLDAVLSRASFFVLVLPLTPDTRGLIATRQLGLLLLDAGF